MARTLDIDDWKPPPKTEPKPVRKSLPQPKPQRIMPLYGMGGVSGDPSLPFQFPLPSTTIPPPQPFSGAPLPEERVKKLACNCSLSAENFTNLDDADAYALRQLSQEMAQRIVELLFEKKMFERVVTLGSRDVLYRTSIDVVVPPDPY